MDGEKTAMLAFSCEYKYVKINAYEYVSRYYISCSMVEAANSCY